MSAGNHSLESSHSLATFFWICLVVALFILFFGGVLSVLGIVPPLLIKIAALLGGIAVFLTGIGLKVERVPFKELWSAANHRQVVIGSPIAVVLMSVIILTVIAFVMDPYIHKGTLLIDDPLATNSSGFNWDQTIAGPGGSSQCKFSGTAFFVSDSTPSHSHSHSEPTTYCQAKNTSFKNFIYEVQMIIIKGDVGGIRFRDEEQNAYYFGLQQNGDFDFREYLSPDYTINASPCGDPDSNIVTCGHTKSFHIGLHQTNRIAIVITSDSYINLYVNLQMVRRVYVAVHSNCQIGVFVRRENSPDPTVVEFSNAKVWQVP